MRAGKFAGSKTVEKFPIPMGVLRNVEEETYDSITTEQVEKSIALKGKGDLQSMLNSGDTWEIN